MSKRTGRQPQDLPQREDTWHAFVFKMRTWVMGEDNELMRPYGLMILDLTTTMVLRMEMAEAPTPDWVGEMVLKAITKPLHGSQPHRPQAITFADSELVNALTPRLLEIGVVCRQMDTPEGAFQLVNELSKFLEKDAPDIPGLLSVPGVTPEFVGELFAAATEFYRAAPWVQLYNVQGLAVRLASQAEPWYVAVMGNAGVEYGLSVSVTWDDFQQMAGGAQHPRDAIPASGGHSLLFNEMPEVPFDDLDAIEQYHWQVPGENTIPFPMIFDRNASVTRPDRSELLWYQAALRAIPIFVREHLHPDGQGDYAPAEANISVPTSDGEATVIIRYPAGQLDHAAEPTMMLDWEDEEDEDKDVAHTLHFDRRMMEGQLASLGRQAGGESLYHDPKLRRAQEIMYRAWETENPGRRIALAHEALSISPDCADAYVLLAEEEADTVGRALEFYQQGVEAGERALGDHFQELAGNFWLTVETRPYMRARQGLADTLWRLGRREEAATHMQEMLHLNPNDNQGVRYLLVDLLLQMEHEAEVLGLLNQYRGDWSATWHYTRALLAFRKSGATDKANKALKRALKQNPHVPPYLTGQKRIPNRLPDRIGMGDENEAVAYSADHLNHWRRTEGAVEWLKEQLVQPVAPKPSSKKPKEPLWDEVFDALLADATGPVAVDELVKQALTRKSSKAKNPAKAVETHLREPYARKPYVFVDHEHVVPLRLALQGVRFRIALDRQMVSSGAVPLYPYFYPFLRNMRSATDELVVPTFENDRGMEIPAEITKQRVKTEGLFGESAKIDVQVVDLKSWLSSLDARRDDSLLLTILDWEEGRFQLAFEPGRRRRKNEIAGQNQALADLIYELLEATYDERIVTERAVLTAYARLASARDYPGDHWTAVLEKDERMRWDDWQILHADSDHLSLFDAFGDEPEEEAVEEKPFTAQQGKQVYRFQAIRGSKEFVIEAQGANTLGDLDAVMKEAFKLDTWDHLSEFSLITPRGKGKQPRAKHFGAMDPLGEYAAHHVRIAGLGLAAGAQLEYLYDFGDNIEHALLLDAIEEPEKGAEYPRFRRVRRKKQ